MKGSLPIWQERSSTGRRSTGAPPNERRRRVPAPARRAAAARGRRRSPSRPTGPSGCRSFRHVRHARRGRGRPAPPVGSPAPAGADRPGRIRRRLPRVGHAPGPRGGAEATPRQVGHRRSLRALRSSRKDGCSRVSATPTWSPSMGPIASRIASASGWSSSRAHAAAGDRRGPAVERHRSRAIGTELCAAVAASRRRLCIATSSRHNVMHAEDGRVVLMDFGAGRSLTTRRRHWRERRSTSHLSFCPGSRPVRSESTASAWSSISSRRSYPVEADASLASGARTNLMRSRRCGAFDRMSPRRSRESSNGPSIRTRTASPERGGARAACALWAADRAWSRWRT